MEKVEFDIYQCDHNKHFIMIEAPTDRSMTEDVIRCPYHKCGAEFSYSVGVDKEAIEDTFWGDDVKLRKQQKEQDAREIAEYQESLRR